MSGATTAMPYIGSKISLITNSDLRYEGKLVSINTANSTVILSGVRMFGTEDRPGANFVMASPEVFDYIVFNGRDVKDLTVSEASFSVKEDPAVVAVNVAPHRMMGGPGGPGMGGMGHMQGPGGHRQLQGGNRGNIGYNGASGRHYDYERRNMRGGGLAGPRGVVGELTAQPNSSLKTQVAPNFNFEEANSKFNKGQATDGLDEAQLPNGPVYDKNSSFFDQISCEALNRQQGRSSKMAREKQREIDTETFGSAAAAGRAPRYYRRSGYNRRMGGPGGMRGRMYDNGLVASPHHRPGAPQGPGGGLYGGPGMMHSRGNAGMHLAGPLGVLQ